MGTPEIHQESSTPRVIERNQRLSRSLLWDLQRRFFEQKGIEAWRQNIVPHYITSNPFIANAYVELVLGFLRDCRANALPLDLQQPVYIVELGAGSGRFAFHFLKQFQRLHARSALRDLPVKYIMTDLGQATIDAWQAHPWLQPLVEEGLLDYAAFDAVADTELRLNYSGKTLSPGSVTNPLVVVANYFFDSIPHDAFYIEDGQLYETLIVLSTPDQEPDLSDPDLLNRIEVGCVLQPVDGSYYDDSLGNYILREYEQRLADTFFLFPSAPIDCIRRLGDLSAGRLLLLSADKGYSREADFQGRDQLGIVVHGSISLTVNYHALGQYIRKRGGVVLHSTHQHSSLGVWAFVLGMSSDQLIESQLAYTTAIEEFGPDDFFTLKQAIEKAYDTLTTPQIISYLRMSRWDADVLLGCVPTLLDRVDALSGPERQGLSEALQQVWEMYYPIGEKRDLAFHIGALLYGMGRCADALTYFRWSLVLYGPHPSTLYNLGVCHYCLRQLEEARIYVDRALALAPDTETFQATRDEIEGALCDEGSSDGSADAATLPSPIRPVIMK